MKLFYNVHFLQCFVKLIHNNVMHCFIKFILNFISLVLFFVSTTEETNEKGGKDNTNCS